MGRPKALLNELSVAPGQPLVTHLAACYLNAGCTPVVVVVGGAHQAAIASAVASMPRVVVLTNPDPSRGMISSLQLGLEAALSAGADAICFSPVDLPIRGADTVLGLLAGTDTGDREPGAPLRIAHWRGQPGHPVRVAGAALAALVGAGHERSARDVMAAYDRVAVEIDDPGICGNLNTPGDLHAWRARSGDRPAVPWTEEDGE